MQIKKDTEKSFYLAIVLPEHKEWWKIYMELVRPARSADHTPPKYWRGNSFMGKDSDKGRSRLERIVSN